MAIGFWVYRRGGGLLIPSIAALTLLYIAIYLGVYHFNTPVFATAEAKIPGIFTVVNPVVCWTIILMTYCFVASVLPVWTLLQPRDYINSHQLMVALALLVGGILVATSTGQADLVSSAPAIAEKMPAGAPPIWPFLFITIACGAVSGFHCLVSRRMRFVDKR